MELNAALKSFIVLHPVLYNFLRQKFTNEPYKLERLSTVKPFQPSLMFACKPRAYGLKHLSGVLLFGRLLALGQAGKACQAQTLQLIENIRKLRRQKVL